MKVRFDKISNDLFWDIFDSDEGKTIRWSGYNDNFWWQNIATSDQFQIRGKYRLNPFNNTVSIEEWTAEEILKREG